MSAYDKYNTPPPKVKTGEIVDNPLLPHSGVPLKDDGFPDSTERIISATNTNDVRWNADPGQFYGDAELSGIDLAQGSNKKFDLGQFNKVFEREKELTVQSQRLKDLEKLEALSKTETQTKLYNLSILEIIINSKNTWFNLLDDLLDQRFELSTFTKDNRLFYVGLTILTFAVILYLYTMIINEDNEQSKEQTTNK